MHVTLSTLAIPFRWLWNRITGRPTVRAERSVVASRDQTLHGAVATGEGGGAASEHGAVATSGGVAVGGTGPTFVVQPGATLNLNLYVDGLPEATPEVRDHFKEGQRLQEAHEHDKAIAEFQAALATADTDSRRGALHLLVAASYYLSGRLAQAEGSCTEALRLFTAARDDEGRAAGLTDLGLVYGNRGDLHRAEEHHRKALEIHRRIDDPLGEASDLGNLGIVYGIRGDLEQAEEHYKQALEIFRRVDNPVGQAYQLGNLGNVYLRRGDLERAEEHHKQALEIERRIGDPLGQAAELGNLGNVYATGGDLERAEECYRRVLEIHERVPNALSEANALSNLGLLAEQRGQPDEARRLLTEALAIYERIGAGGRGPELVRAALRRLEEAGGEEKPRRPARKRKDQEPPAG